jgi:preprotein translocase subunit SecE
MSRAVRRQQQSAPKEGGNKRGLGLKSPRPTRGQRPPVQSKRRLRLSRPGWFEDVIAELKKVAWPSRDEAVYLTTVVVIVALVVGALLGTVDIFFNWLIDRLLLR